MANLVEMGIIKIMEIGKEGIWSVFAAEKKGIIGMIVYYGSYI
jgi:hypothetical protein